MLINHRTAQLGVVNQKRPEVWLSYPEPHKQAEDLASVVVAMGDHILNNVAYDTKIIEGNSVVLDIGEHKLYDPTQAINQLDEVRVNIGMGDHILNDMLHTVYNTKDVVSVTISMGDHKLYVWGVRAELLDEDNAKVSIDMGDHKLYEE